MPLHAVIITHTDRLLEPVLLGAATQTLPAHQIVIGVDGDDPAIRASVQRVANRVGRSMTLVTRPHQGEARSGQVRNNAVRSLARASGVCPADRVLVLDGDTIPAIGCFEAHERIGGPRHTVLGLRHMLSESQSSTIDADTLLAGRPPCDLTSEQERVLRTLSRRWRRNLWLRKFMIIKRHKPQLISCHFSCILQGWVDVNGFDEEYTGYGFEDDDFGRRLYEAGFPPRLAYLEATAWHQYHPTRAGLRVRDYPNFERFQQPWSVRCEHGLNNCMPQPDPIVELIEPSS